MNRTRTLFAFCFAAFGLVILRPASAAPSFDKLPGEQGKTSPLLMRIVQYKGSTNGAITVEVKNPTDTAQEFSAKGIYFVPTANANEAPQRLGAVGPFQLQSANGTSRRMESDDDRRRRHGAVDAGRLLHRFAPREPQLVDVVPRREGPRSGVAGARHRRRRDQVGRGPGRRLRSRGQGRRPVRGLEEPRQEMDQAGRRGRAGSGEEPPLTFLADPSP